MSRGGLKISNEKSTVTAPPSAAISEASQNADEAMARMKEYKERAWNLGAKLKSLMESKVLPENKTAVLKGLESETLQELSQLATDINVDEDQLEGSGSVALSQLILKMMLIQKDQINALAYHIDQLEKNNYESKE